MPRDTWAHWYRYNSGIRPKDNWSMSNALRGHRTSFIRAAYVIDGVPCILNFWSMQNFESFPCHKSKYLILNPIALCNNKKCFRHLHDVFRMIYNFVWIGHKTIIDFYLFFHFVDIICLAVRCSSKVCVDCLCTGWADLRRGINEHLNVNLYLSNVISEHKLNNIPIDAWKIGNCNFEINVHPNWIRRFSLSILNEVLRRVIQLNAMDTCDNTNWLRSRLCEYP